MFLEQMRQKVRGKGSRIIYAEGKEERAIKAALLLKDNDLARPMLLGKRTEIEAKAKSLALDLSGIVIHEPEVDPKRDHYANTYYELRKHKGITLEAAQAKAILPNY